MSKIGKINISIPDKVKVVMSGNILNIEGPMGKKSLNIDLDIFNLDISNNLQCLKIFKSNNTFGMLIFLNILIGKLI